MMGIASGKTDGSLAGSGEVFGAVGRLTGGVLREDHVKCDPQEQQTAGDLKGADVDPERFEQRLADESEDQQRNTRYDGGASRDDRLIFSRTPFSQRNKCGGRLNRIHDGQQRDEDVEGLVEPGRHYADQLSFACAAVRARDCGVVHRPVDEHRKVPHLAPRDRVVLAVDVQHDRRVG